MQNSQGTLPARWNTQQLVTMAFMAAISTVLSFIEIPLFPAAPFLKYDPSFVPAVMGAFAFGPLAGCIISFVSVIAHVFITSNIWGGVMTIICACAYLVPLGLAGKTKNASGHIPTVKLIVGFFVGSLAMIIVALLSNLVVTPIYTGAPLQSIIAMIIPILLPFNIAKVLLNSIISALVYKSIAVVLHKYSSRSRA